MTGPQQITLEKILLPVFSLLCHCKAFFAVDVLTRVYLACIKSSMAVTDLFGPTPPRSLGPGEERAIFIGDPAGGVLDIGRDAFWDVWVVPAPGSPPGFNVEVVRTWVEEVQGRAGLRYLVRNNNPNQSVSFIRFAIRVRP
jgi:hypothetical protein